jgi:hypothetical protein
MVKEPLRQVAFVVSQSIDLVVFAPVSQGASLIGAAIVPRMFSAIWRLSAVDLGCEDTL